MAYRKKIKKRTSKKIFRKTAGVHPKNDVGTSIMRGGTRL